MLGNKFVNLSGGGPADPNQSIQFNDNGAFGGDADLTWDNTNKILNIDGTIDADHAFTAGASGTTKSYEFDTAVTVSSSSSSSNQAFVAEIAGGGAGDLTGDFCLVSAAYNTAYSGSGTVADAVGASMLVGVTPGGTITTGRAFVVNHFTFFGTMTEFIGMDFISPTDSPGFGPASTVMAFNYDSTDWLVGEFGIPVGLDKSVKYTILSESEDGIVMPTKGTDVATVDLLLTAQGAFASAVTNITGSDVLIEGGNGVSSTTEDNGHIISNDSSLQLFRDMDWGEIASVTTYDDALLWVSSTTSGSDSARRILILAEMLAGYTGSEFTEVLGFDNVVAGTNTTYFSDASSFGFRPGGNRGIGGFARATTVGHNIGGMMLAGGGDVNYAVWGASTITKNSAVNVGLFGSALNVGTSGIEIGVYATLLNQNTAPTFGQSAALLVDNGAAAEPIAVYRDNGTEVGRWADGGTFLVLTTNESITIDGTTVTPNILVQDDGARSRAPVMRRNTTSNVAPGWRGARSRGTAGTPTVVGDGDFLAEFVGSGFDGADYHNGGGMRVIVDGTPGSNDIPAATALYARAQGAGIMDQAAIFSQDITMILGDAAGANQFIIEDSAGTDRFTATSDGITDVIAAMADTGNDGLTVTTTVTPTANTANIYTGSLVNLNTASGFDFTSVQSGLRASTASFTHAVAGTVAGSAGFLSFLDATAGTLTSHDSFFVVPAIDSGATVTQITGVNMNNNVGSGDAVKYFAFRFGDDWSSNDQALLIEHDGNDRFLLMSTTDTGLTFDSTDLILETTTSGDILLNSADDVIIKLGDDVGVNFFVVEDSAGVDRLEVFSDGLTTIFAKMDDSSADALNAGSNITPTANTSANYTGGAFALQTAANAFDYTATDTALAGVGSAVFHQGTGDIASSAEFSGIIATTGGSATITIHNVVEHVSFVDTGDTLSVLNGMLLNNNFGAGTVTASHVLFLGTDWFEDGSYHIEAGSYNFVPMSTAKNGITLAGGLDLTFETTGGGGDIILTPDTTADVVDINARIDQDASYPDTLSGSSAGHSGTFTISNSGNSTATIYGDDFLISKVDSNNLVKMVGQRYRLSVGPGGTNNTVVGIESTITHGGAGTTDLAHGIDLQLLQSAGTVTTYNGIRFNTPGTVTNLYAFDFKGDFVVNSFSVPCADDGTARFIQLSTANTGITVDSQNLIFETTTSGDIQLNTASATDFVDINSQVDQDFTTVDAAGDVDGVDLRLTVTNTANNANSFRGLVVRADHTDAFDLTSPQGGLTGAILEVTNTGSGTVATSIGVNGNIQNSGTGTLTLATSNFSLVQNTSTGTITDGAGITIAGGDDGSGTFTNMYALNLFNAFGTAATNVFLINLDSSSEWLSDSRAFPIDDDGTTKFLPMSIQSGGMSRKTTRITGTYTILVTDHTVYCDTDGGAFTVTLPVGQNELTYRIINVGSSGNDVTLAPNGSELLNGVNASELIIDSEKFILTYETTEGWW